MTWRRPLLSYYNIPTDAEPGAFMTARKFHTHEGVDLYAPLGTPIYAVEDGLVEWVGLFTGPRLGHAHWLSTQAIMVTGATGTVVYGEVTPLVIDGDVVRAGQQIATVAQVLRKDKGRPMCMLHLELRKPGHLELFDWSHGKERPHWLLDPTPHLLATRQAELDRIR